MSSHREAPEIALDPVADSTDVYAFVSPDKPDTVTLIANYIPLEGPAAGPNFYEFGESVFYQIHIDNDGDGYPNISYQFHFENQVTSPNTFLYNTGQITSLTSSAWNRRQTYTVVKKQWSKDDGKTIGSKLACPPCNVGPRSTPNYAALAAAAIHHLPTGETVFAGQRREGFYVDLGSIFDLGDLRPFQNLHLIPTAAAPGVDATKAANVHTIALQIPKAILARHGEVPTSVNDAHATIGVWTTASRRQAVIRAGHEQTQFNWQVGPWAQVSRLGNPLINEVIIPMGKKDYWNTLQPDHDEQFADYYAHPELAKPLPVLYPNVFPHLAAYTAARADLQAILLTGLPSGFVPNFQNYTGSKKMDMLRLNLAVPPTTSNPNPLGVIGGDLAGFPNGRRVFDDVVTIEIRAIAGVTLPLVDHTFTPDGAASLVTDGLTPDNSRYQGTFPYLGTPLDGYDTPAS